MGNILKKTRLREKKEKYCYISLLFDINRGGVADIAENILLFLDYESFKNFKRTCKMVHQFVINSKIEQMFIANLPKELSGCLKMKIDYEYENNFTHNLCDELTRLGPRISFGYGDFNIYPLVVHATPRKLEVVSTTAKKQKIKDSEDHITFEEFIEIHSSVHHYHRENIIGKTPSTVFWYLMQFGNIFQKIKNPDCEKCGPIINENSGNCYCLNEFSYQPEHKYEDIEKDKNAIKEAIWSFIKNEQVRKELFKDLEDFIKLVKKRGSFGACFLPDPFGRIVDYKNAADCCIFATEAYCYRVSHIDSFETL